VIGCAETGLGADRRQLGWSVPEARGYRSVASPDAAQVAQLVGVDPAHTLHIFSGIRWVPSIVAALAEVRRTGARFAIMSEPRVREGWRGELRFLQSWLSEGWLRRHVSFVLGIGRSGPIWFESVGYAADRLFPFAYFVDAQNAPVAMEVPRPVGAPIRVGYLGRLVRDKGVFDLVAACATLRGRCVLELAGKGDDREMLEKQTAADGVAATFLGAIPLATVGEFLARVDVLVLASTTSDDGWGVAASEALLAGVPVVLTRQVGASLAVVRSELGRVVDANAPAQIAEAIGACGTPEMTSPHARAQRRDWARRVLDAPSGARNLLAIVRWIEGKGPKPAAFHEQPWPPPTQKSNR
jgi:glycosyltransferase involved in cell wall biosynthesis